MSLQFPEILKTDLASKFGAEPLNFSTTSVGDHVIEASRSNIHALLQYLKEYAGFDFLMDVCGADYPTRQKRFDVVYHLFSSRDYSRVRVKVQLAEGEPIATATNIWLGADWFEYVRNSFRRSSESA
jgi:NADH-quinone oxidoreductase subunit C/D